MRTLRHYGIGKALGCVTSDNVAMIPALCTAVLEDEIPGWQNEDGHVRWMATEAHNNHYDRLSILQRPTIDFVFHHTKPPPHIKKSEPDKKKQRSK
jgi:hypothetical protein